MYVCIFYWYAPSLFVCALFPYILCVLYTLFVHFLRYSTVYFYLHFLLHYSVIIVAFYSVGFAFLSTYKVRTNAQTHKIAKKKNTLSNPREIKRGKSSNLTNKLFCPILLLFFFEPGSQHRAISAKQSEYKWVEGVDDGLEGEGICKSWNCQQTIKNAAAQKT